MSRRAMIEDVVEELFDMIETEFVYSRDCSTFEMMVDKIEALFDKVGQQGEAGA